MSVKFLDHVDVRGNRVQFLGAPVDDTDATNRRWVLDNITRLINESGDLNTEEVQDVVAAMLAGTNIAFAYDDAAGTLTLSVTDSPTVGGRSAAYLTSRTNHTGMQSLDTTTDSATRVAFTPDERDKLGGVATGATRNATDAFLTARANHTGTMSADDLVDGTANRVFTVADETKLDGIATGATANATNEALRDRATHTGTQPLNTITGHDKAAHDALRLDAETVEGLTLAELRDIRETTGQLTADRVTSTENHFFITADEAARLAAVETGATANADDAFLVARANHTGTQSADTIVDGSANKVFTAADNTKLDGIADGATKNATDADLRNRATHTGTQDVSTITGLTGAFISGLGGVDADTLNGASRADIESAVTAAIVGSAPETLDTLNEIAAALGDNPAAITDLFSAVALRNRTHAETIGDGTATSFVVTHGLGTDVTVQIWETTGDRELVSTTVRLTSAEAVTVVFGSAPATGAYRVVVQGRP